MQRPSHPRYLLQGPLVLASHNPGKITELQAIIPPSIRPLYSIKDLGLPEPEETGVTFEENALIKAKQAAILSKLPSLADDSGIVIPALDGAPGVVSARWAGEKRDFNVAMGKVYKELGKKGITAITGCPAFFISVLAIAWPDGHHQSFEGRIDGTLAWPPRGTKGFGYDAMFVPDGYTQTFGEMDPTQKNTISHRAKAFAKFKEFCLHVSG